jgi:hypothetical protein
MAYDDSPNSDDPDEVSYSEPQAFLLGVIHTLAYLEKPVTINGLAKICSTDPDRIEALLFELEELKALMMEEDSSEISFPGNASPFSDN